jgi:transposase InsO family protein
MSFVVGTNVNWRQVARIVGIRDHPTAPRSPWQNGHVERLIGSIRRECLEHIVVLGEAQLAGSLRPTPAITTVSERIYSWTKIRRAIDRSSGSASSLLSRFSGDCITNIAGYGFRQAQGCRASRIPSVAS